MKLSWTLVIASASGAALTLLYLSAVIRGVITGAIFPATSIEAAILGTLLARLLVIMAVPRLRRSSSLALNIMSAEVLLLPVLVLISLTTADPLYLQLIREIFFAWPAAFMAVSPLYTIPKLVQRISAGSSLSTVIPSLTSLFALLAFLDLGLGNGASGTGLSNVTKFALLSAAGTSSSFALPTEIAVTGVAAYASMIFYALRRDSGAFFTDSILGIAAAGTLLALVWAFVVSYLTSSAQLVFGVPALILVGLTWGLSRAR
ncbi:MAG TPA: hypothetical protein VGR56_03610 [Nitrososphaerales archaeon]|nr:hypothetical protein [Nitrososphaerales archaeon]